MSHKVHPLGFRLGVNENWNARWFDTKNFPKKLAEDVAIREYLKKKLRSAGIDKIEIERTANNLTIIINSSRPGIIIGRAGAGAEILKKDIEKILFRVRREKNRGIPAVGAFPEARIEVREVRNPESFAAIVGINVAEQLERRMPFRYVLKRTMERIMVNRDVKGAKITISGRLGGAEMARREWVQEGNMPRNTLRSIIDFSVQEAYTTYGVVGVKVWIYKGQRLDHAISE